MKVSILGISAILLGIVVWLFFTSSDIEPYVFNKYYANASDSPINATTPDIWFWRASWKNVSQQSECVYDEYNIVKTCNTTYVPMVHIKALTNNETLANELGCVICRDADFDVSCPQVSESRKYRTFIAIPLLLIIFIIWQAYFKESENYEN